VIRTYSELMALPTFEERLRYLRLQGRVGEETFGFGRWMNQRFYTSREWARFRDKIILRDNGCDLGDPDRVLGSHIIIHHMNPITEEQLVHFDTDILNPEYVICCSPETHRAIHYGDEKQALPLMAERHSGDTCPWKR
jgi:hypothetical protein